MVNLKDYQTKELCLYVMTNISVLLLLLGFLDHPEQSVIQTIEVISNILNMVILSAAIFTFTFLTDSIFSSEIKFHLAGFQLPGGKIFSRIKNKNIDKRFSREDAILTYKNIYESMPNEKKERYVYENSQFYKIYNQYRNVTMIMVSNRDFLLCRDIYFSTISTIALYLLLTILFKIIAFDWRYIVYLALMLIVANLGLRNKGWRFVCNIIAYDISNHQTGDKIEGV
jgi:hypothetical protein